MQNIHFLPNNRIVISGFNNPWNNRDLWHSFLDINLIKKICGETPINIIEFGSYDGADGIRYKYHFPNTNVYSIEPSPPCYNNIKPLEEYGLKVFNYAISNKNGEIDFYQTFDTNNNNYAPCGAVDIQFCSTEQGKGIPLKIIDSIKVPSITIEQFCIDQNIKILDLIHIDVEGHAPQVLEGFGNIRPKMIYIEVKSDTHNHTDVINKLLLKLNYTKIRIQGSDEIWVPS